MKYRKDRYGNEISILGYGCMRFSTKGGRPDIEKTKQEILKAYEAGVNYYDAAYTYPGIEAALGEILESLKIRDKVKIATKFPHYMLKKEGNIEKFFKEELKRLRTDHVDYYLMHMLTDVKTWERLKGFGIEEWIREKKASGEIGQIGFSYHGNADMFKQLIDAYDWDFCQIQYNYMDEHSQAGVEGLKYAHEKGLPVIIMEPLRGGKLAKDLPKEAMDLFNAYPVRRSPAEWGLRWLYDQPEVTCVLSGMNSVQMVEENCRVASEAEAGAFTEAEQTLLKNVAAVLNAKMKVGCTGCRYCMPCPHGVDIPGTFAAYNRRYTEGKFTAIKEYIMCDVFRKTPTLASNCIGCGACETHCPQHIEIRQELKNAQKVLEGPVVQIVKKFGPMFVKY